MRWYKVLASGFKLIYCPDALRQAITSRISDVDIIIDEPTDDAAFVDYPGACLIDRKTWTAMFSNGLTIEMPITDFHSFLHQVNNIEQTTHDGQTYYRLFGHLTGIAMTHEMLIELKGLMIKDKLSIEKEAALEIERLNEKLTSLKNSQMLPQKKNVQWN